VNRKIRVSLLLSSFVLLTSTLGVCFASQYWINQTVQVSAGGSYYWSGTLHAGNRLQGSFTVGGGDIKFYILDGSNYAKYANGQVFTSYYRNQAIQVPQVDFVVPYDGTWFVLLDNSYSIWTNKAVTVTLTLDSSSYSGSNDSTSGIPSYVWLLIVFVVLAVVGAIIRNSNEAQKRKNQPTYGPQQT
jgi:hypothetical protein